MLAALEQVAGEGLQRGQEALTDKVALAMRAAVDDQQALGEHQGGGALEQQVCGQRHRVVRVAAGAADGPAPRIGPDAHLVGGVQRRRTRLGPRPAAGEITLPGAHGPQRVRQLALPPLADGVQNKVRVDVVLARGHGDCQQVLAGPRHDLTLRLARGGFQVVLRRRPPPRFVEDPPVRLVHRRLVRHVAGKHAAVVRIHIHTQVGMRSGGHVHGHGVDVARPLAVVLQGRRQGSGPGVCGAGRVVLKVVHPAHQAHGVLAAPLSGLAVVPASTGLQRLADLLRHIRGQRVGAVVAEEREAAAQDGHADAGPGGLVLPVV